MSNIEKLIDMILKSFQKSSQVISVQLASFFLIIVVITLKFIKKSSPFWLPNINQLVSYEHIYILTTMTLETQSM